MYSLKKVINISGAGIVAHCGIFKIKFGSIQSPTFLTNNDKRGSILSEESILFHSEMDIFT